MRLSYRRLLCVSTALALVGLTSPGAAGTITYAYDELGRLKQVQYADGGQVSYTYDAAGNRTRVVAAATGGGNRPPIAAPDIQTTTPGVAVTVLPLGNDSDPDGDALVIQSTTSSRAALASDQRSLIYTPAAGFTGQDVFNYTISDGRGGTASSTITVTVAAPNNSPVAQNDSATTNTNTAKNINVLANDSDPDGDAINVSAVTQPQHGSTSFTGSSVTYQPATGYGGPDSFQYSISDGRGGSATATVSVAVNRPPVAVTNSGVVISNVQTQFSVVSNDHDPDGDPITLLSVTQPAHGYAAVGTYGWVYYTPSTNYVGPDSFTYTIGDGRGGTAIGTVNLTVVVYNVAPVANNDTVSTSTNAPISVSVLSNDTDSDGNSLSVVSVGQPSNGSASFTSSSVTYVPNPNFAGQDSFTYQISDGNGGSASATVNVSVVAPTPTLQAVNDTLTAQNYLIPEFGYYVQGCVNPLANDVLPLGSAAVVGFTQPPIGSVAFGDGGLCFTAGDYMTGANGSFIYYIQDSSGAISGATISIYVVPG